MAKEIVTQGNSKPDCFVIMPISDPEGYEKGHFQKVYDDIFKVACEKTNFNPIRADEVKQTNLIHVDILQKLIHSPMAICDLSTRNPNVLFELGLRQAFDKPTILVRELGTPAIFDISGLRYTEYRKELKYREVLEDQDSIAETLKATKEATDKGEGINSIINLLSLSSPAALKDVTDNDSAKMLQIVMSEMNDLRADFRKTLRRLDEREGFSDRYDMEIEKIHLDYKRFEEYISKGAPIELVKEQYDRIQSRTLRLMDRPLPVNRRGAIKDMLREADHLISNYMAKGDKNN